MASKRKREYKPRHPRDPFALGMATRTGNGAGSHKPKPKPKTRKGTRKQQNEWAIYSEVD